MNGNVWQQIWHYLLTCVFITSSYPETLSELSPYLITLSSCCFGEMKEGGDVQYVWQGAQKESTAERATSIY